MGHFRVSCLLAFLCVLCSATPSARAQDTDPNFELGLKPFGSYQAGNIDTVSLGNGSLSFDIPLISYPQRGGKLKLDFSLLYFNIGVYADQQCYPPPVSQCWWIPNTTGGGILGVIDKGDMTASATAAGQTYPAILQAGEVDGAVHIFGATGTNVVESVDATAFHATWNPNNDGFATVTDSQGTSYTGLNCYATNLVGVSGPCVGAREDVNGNKITVSSDVTTDTMGRTIPQWTTSTNSSDFTGCTGPQPILSVQLWSPPGVNGGVYPLKFCAIGGYDAYGDPVATPSLLQSIVLPNGTAWTIQYVLFNTGIIPGDNTSPMQIPVPSQITFPTGGTLSYAWISTAACNTHQIVENLAVSSRMLNPNDGITPASTWNYRYNTSQSTWTTLLTDPLGNDSVHTFGLGGCYLYETQTQDYQGSHTSGTLLKTVNTTYSYTVLGWSYPSILANLVPTKVTTAWANGQTNQILYSYDSGFQFQPVACCGNPLRPPNPISGVSGSAYITGTYGRQLTKSEYDYGNGAPGALMRTTTNTWLALNNSTYKTYNLFDLPSSVQLKDGGGTQRAYATYSYDQYSLASSGITTQHVTPPNGSYRGNLTSVSRWLSGSTTATTNCNITVSNGYLSDYKTYNDTGTVATSVDSCGTSYTDANHKTTYAYSSMYIGALPTTITNPLNQSVSNAYDFNTGLLTSTTDPNSQTKQYHYDSMLRTTEIDAPDGGQATFSYPTPNEVDITEKMDTLGRYKSASLLVDGVGREIRQIVSNGETTPYDQADTSYDSLGRVAFKSYPYQANGFSTARVTSGVGDSFAYDALGRATSVTHSDGSTVLTSYMGRATSVQDEGNGTQRVQRIMQVDGLGRLASVCEVTSATLSVGINGSTTPAACGQDITANGFLTTYAYDTLDNLTWVTQGPLTARTFTYDSLARLTSGTNPESGTTTYTYDADGNVLTKTDARTAKVTYAYDVLNRLTGKTYSDSTPAATYNYDQTSAMGVTLTNTIGRKSSESMAGTNSTGSVFSYDSMGRVLNNSQCTPQNCSGTPFSLAYTYDLLGDMLTSTNGAGVTLTNALNTGARLTSLTSSLSDSNHPGTLLSSGHYNAAGAVLSASLGNGVSEARTYDARIRLAGITDGSLYTVTIPTSGGYAPNSDILAANDSVNGNWTYAYDAFNRLTSANATGQAYTYAYDRFGNRWQQNGPHSSQLGFDANNRIVSGSGVAYDAAGDTTNDGSTAYTFDAEGRITTAVNSQSGTSTYVYDAEGRRVRKATVAGGTVDFLYDLAGHEISQITSTGSWTRGEVYAGGRHLATYGGGTGGTTYFIHPDWLGTERARSTSAGASYETCTSLPFGDWLTCSGGNPSPMHFTGKEHDTETNLENFGARYDASSMGRFMTPDPSDALVLHIVSPQRWNMYAYGIDSPLAYTDPTGRDAIAVNFSKEVPVGGHEGIIVVSSDGSATYARFGPQHEAQSADKGKVTVVPLDRVTFDANGLPTENSYESLAKAVASVEHESADTVRMNYFKTSAAETASLAAWIEQWKHVQAPDYSVDTTNCAAFTICGLIQGGAIENKNISLVPNKLFSLLQGRADENWTWQGGKKPNPEADAKRHKKAPCLKRRDGTCVD